MKKVTKFLLVLLFVVVAAVGLLRFFVTHLAFVAPVSPDDPKLIAELDQGWSEENRSYWYGATQGSRLMPLDWLEALEAPDSKDLFMAPQHISQLRFIPRRVKLPDRDSYAQLAVGFSIDDRSDEHLIRTRIRWKKNQSNSEHWVGLNCAACHTSKITYKGADIRVDGGQAMIDFQSFVEVLNRSLQQTFDDTDKWKRFEAKVLAADAADAENKKMLRKVFADLLDWQKQEANANQLHTKDGFGRIDAFGRIFNKVALLVDDKEQKFNPPDAPVSIPFIWSAPQYNKVQYNGIAPKFKFWGIDAGALARNTGEVIGVFGDVVLKNELGTDGFASSISVENIYVLEEQLRNLRSPKWPTSIFGPFTEEEKTKDAKLVGEGRVLYQEYCLVCHDVVDRQDTERDIHLQDNEFIGVTPIAKERLAELPASVHEKKITPPSTDPWMACNSYLDRSKTGMWSSEKPVIVDFESIGRKDKLQLGRETDSNKLLTLTVAGVLGAQQNSLATIIGNHFLNLARIPEGVSVDIQGTTVFDGMKSLNVYERPPHKTQKLKNCEKVARALATMSDKVNILNYTSRPLNGIWATAPYLHNGSVPTLYDLLLPPNKRPTSFYMGSYEYDPAKVGYVTEKSKDNSFLFVSRWQNGDRLGHVDGNTNAGHNYFNAKLTHDDRMALVAYLKTL